MKIKKLLVKDFQGLHGKREYSFEDKLVVLAAPNGSGKSSMLNALRFGLSGQVPKGKVCADGAAKADVGIVFQDGQSVIREQPEKGSAKYWVNNRVSTKSGVQEALQKESGANAESMKIATASELVGNMKPQELMEFMLSFIPAAFTADKIMQYTGEIPFSAEQTLRQYLPQGQFGTDALQKTYEDLFALRKEKKKRVADAASAIHALGAVQMPEETEEELTKAYREAYRVAMNAHEEWTAYDAKVKTYTAIKATIDKQSAYIDTVKNQIAALDEKLKSVEGAPEQSPAPAYEAAKEELRAAEGTLRMLTAGADAVKKALATLECSTCPLSDKLVCTTDKTPIREELNTSIAASEKEIKKQEKKIAKLNEKVTAAGNLLALYNEAERIRQHRPALEERLKIAESSMPKLPEVPKKPATVYDPNALSMIQEKLSMFPLVKKLEAYKKQWEVLSREVEDLETLVSALAPNGRVRNQITQNYLLAFEQFCNDKADVLKPGMRLRFLSGKGITPVLDVRGDGNFLPYDALSGGEKILMVYLLLGMFNEMCGLRILILDELSVLDTENFGLLLDVIKNNADDYDQVFLAMVDHEDMMKTLEKKFPDAKPLDLTF